MAWISNHHQIEEKSTKSPQSSSKVVGLGLADLWEFSILITAPDTSTVEAHLATHQTKLPCASNRDTTVFFGDNFGCQSRPEGTNVSLFSGIRCQWLHSCGHLQNASNYGSSWIPKYEKQVRTKVIECIYLNENWLIRFYWNMLLCLIDKWIVCLGYGLVPPGRRPGLLRPMLTLNMLNCLKNYKQ